MEWNQHVLMILLTAVMLVSLLALCYAFQMLDHLDTDKFDIPVQYVISAPVEEGEA